MHFQNSFFVSIEIEGLSLHLRSENREVLQNNRLKQQIWKNVETVSHIHLKSAFSSPKVRKNTDFNFLNPTSSTLFCIIIYTIFAALKNQLNITSSWELNTLNTNNLT